MSLENVPSFFVFIASIFIEQYLVRFKCIMQPNKAELKRMYKFSQIYAVQFQRVLYFCKFFSQLSSLVPLPNNTSNTFFP